MSSESGTVGIAQSALVSVLRNEDFVAQQRAFDRGTTVRDLRTSLSDAEITRIARVVTGRSPSPRTLRRWAQTDRVPNVELAGALERHRFVAANGGVDGIAAMIGRSVSSVRKWMLGRQTSFRGIANDLVAAARIRERMIRGGMMTPGGTLKTPVVELRASVEIRMPGEKGYSYTSKQRAINLRQSDSTEIPPAQAMELAAALVTGRTADALAIISEHASTSYASFAGFSDDLGMHLDSISDWDVTWE
ncbi:hypothetical protein [Gordonia malaquae]|uniref:hypothetical protein n=1 Tax=Gordonia malaquae TaxID=410332 RepID=UPI003019A406